MSSYNVISALSIRVLESWPRPCYGCCSTYLVLHPLTRRCAAWLQVSMVQAQSRQRLAEQRASDAEQLSSELQVGRGYVSHMLHTPGYGYCTLPYGTVLGGRHKEAADVLQRQRIALVAWLAGTSQLGEGAATKSRATQRWRRLRFHVGHGRYT